jgi:hypothetical protein
MNSPKQTIGGRVALLSLAIAVALVPALARSKESKDQAKPDVPIGTRLRVEVTGGDKSIPVDLASVYVRFVVRHQTGRDEKPELDVKTNNQGVAVVPFVPRGKVTVQVVADGWKPYGESYQMTQDEQVIKIHLERPPKWY